MEKKIYEVDVENGTYIFRLFKILDDKHISKNQLMRDTNTDFKVIKRLGTGESIRVDLTVIARLCDYLEVDQTDIIEYKRK